MPGRAAPLARSVHHRLDEVGRGPEVVERELAQVVELAGALATGGVGLQVPEVGCGWVPAGAEEGPLRHGSGLPAPSRLEEEVVFPPSPGLKHPFAVQRIPWGGLEARLEQ